MKLIIGLGNPGEKYQNNRHNVGFMMLDDVVRRVEDRRWRMDKYLDSEISEITINNEKMILAKPQTYMNNSGQAVHKIYTKYEIRDTKYVYVVHDDLDIKLGEYKIQFGKGPKLHNGIESIEKALGTTEFWRIRIGVDNRNPENRMPGEKYVLQDFLSNEKEELLQIFYEINPLIINK